jgi:hypothetical protein
MGGKGISITLNEWGATRAQARVVVLIGSVLLEADRCAAPKTKLAVSVFFGAGEDLA